MALLNAPAQVQFRISPLLLCIYSVHSTEYYYVYTGYGVWYSPVQGVDEANGAYNITNEQLREGLSRYTSDNARICSGQMQNGVSCQK